ncbi:hypothetical protein CRP01_00145 [Flavilitoribacter nigricans DSM 23189 = NBRC 102662]|uniref:Uncharacterized protein n=1 Tax=Flavilitoribacter nigricans (strain ATCC 23147 / DSM 23189 / NBRC 102662 / NCIMB 1420 / SS-2) TaxID=1122177 RepID=A0A2D0NIT9_FLAN2|nr:hypothetical protein CRP01_00145 [Flavilitoribacter nigricans DSM 23189 = NBRC 102662]
MDIAVRSRVCRQKFSANILSNIGFGVIFDHPAFSIDTWGEIFGNSIRSIHLGKVPTYFRQWYMHQNHTR